MSPTVQTTAGIAWLTTNANDFPFQLWFPSARPDRFPDVRDVDTHRSRHEPAERTGLRIATERVRANVAGPDAVAFPTRLSSANMVTEAVECKVDIIVDERGLECAIKALRRKSGNVLWELKRRRRDGPKASNKRRSKRRYARSGHRVTDFPGQKTYAAGKPHWTR